MELKKGIGVDPEEVYARLMCVSHLELGALAYLSLADESLGQTTYGISANITPSASWRDRVNRASTIKNYFDKIFIDIAMVAKNTFVDSPTGQQVTHYSVTPFGRQLQGVGFFLVSEVVRINRQQEKDLSLQHILTNKAGGTPKANEQIDKMPASRRSPYHRAKIIEALAKIPEGQTLNIAKINEDLPLVDSSAISPHIADLKAAGLAEGKGLRPETEGEFVYKKAPDAVLPPDVDISTDKLSIDIRLLLHSEILQTVVADPNSEFSSAGLSNKLYKRHCQERQQKGRNPVIEKVFRQSASRILTELRRQGYFISEFAATEQHSWAKLTPLGREVAGVLQRVRQAIGDPEMAEQMYWFYRATFESFRQSHALQLLELQKEYGQQRKSPEERMTKLLQILRDNPQGLRSMTLQKALGVYSGEYAIRLISEGLVEQEWETSKGRIQPGKHGPGSIYRLTERARSAFIQLPQATYASLA